MTLSRKSPTLLCTLVLIGCAGLLLGYLAWGARRAELRPAGAETEQVSLPHHRAGSPDAVARYHLRLPATLLRLHRLRIFPDDCLEQFNIEGVPQSLEADRRCDYRRGLEVDAAPILNGKRGSALLELQVRNTGGGTGLDLWLIPKPLMLAVLLGVLGAGLAAVWALGRQCGLSSFEAALVAGGLAVRILYFSYTAFDARSHDVQSHLEYIRWLLTQPGLPPKHIGGAFYHPPLYYLAGAGVCRLAALAGLAETTALQLLSLLLAFAFLVCGAAVLKLLFPSPRAAAPPLMLFCFWPAAVIHAPRVSNDAMLYPLCALGLWLILSWQRTGRPGWLWAAMLAAAAATGVKSNGAVLWAACLAAWLCAARYGPWQPSAPGGAAGRRVFAAAALCAVSVAFAFGANLLLALAGSDADWLQGATRSFNAGLAVGNQWDAFMRFDLRDFLTVPFADPWQDPGGRQYFWNYLLKTALFGEFRFTGPGIKALALTMSALLLPGLMIAAAGAIFSANRRTSRLPLLVLTAGLVALCAAYRWKFPLSSAADFRYVLPAILPLLAFFGNALTRARAARLPLLEQTGCLLAEAGAALSMAFFVAASGWF